MGGLLPISRLQPPSTWPRQLANLKLNACIFGAWPEPLKVQKLPAVFAPQKCRCKTQRANLHRSNVSAKSNAYIGTAQMQVQNAARERAPLKRRCKKRRVHRHRANAGAKRSA